MTACLDHGPNAAAAGYFSHAADSEMNRLLIRIKKRQKHMNLKDIQEREVYNQLYELAPLKYTPRASVIFLKVFFKF